VRRLQPGDIVAVPTSQGRAYVQFVRFVKPYGYLIRALPGTFSAPPTDFQDLADQPARFWVFTPLQTIVNRGIFEFAASAKVPKSAARIPLMRVAAGPRPWEASVWWLWDGEREWRTTRDDPAVRDASPKESWNDALLIDRIETGWRPRDELDPPPPSGEVTH